MTILLGLVSEISFYMAGLVQHMMYLILKAKSETKPQEAPANKEMAAKPEAAKQEAAKPEVTKPEAAKLEAAKEPEKIPGGEPISVYLSKSNLNLNEFNTYKSNLNLNEYE